MKELLVGKIILKNLIQNNFLEFIWTIVPIFILLAVGTYSIIILYWIDNIESYDIKLKINGHQWYWEYDLCHWFEYNKIFNKNIECYIINSLELNSGLFRLIETNIRPRVLYENFILTTVRSEDVLHSWTLPSIGVKSDAVPGRNNILCFMRLYPGIFYGQCSEICGSNHRFMPISLQFIRAKDWKEWLYSHISLI